MEFRKEVSMKMTTTISIPSGTIVGRITGDKVTPVTLAARVYVDAYRDYDGSWVYSVGKQQYCCAGELARKEPSYGFSIQ
jgi:hypothetical protein